MALDFFIALVAAKFFEYVLIALVKTLRQYQIKMKDEQQRAAE